MIFGIKPGDVIRLARDARLGASATPPILVTGTLAETLARGLAKDGDRSLVGTSGDPAKAAALIRVVGGTATAADEADLRVASRAGVPIVVVQTGASSISVPYVLASEIIECHPGKGFPLGEIGDALASALGRGAVVLAAGLPVVRTAVERRQVLQTALLGATTAALRSKKGPVLPIITLLQARMLRDLEVARGSKAPEEPRVLALTVGQELGASVAVGVLARSLVRALPVRSRLVDGGVALAATFALGKAASRLR